jgi:PAS domain S-box-containing protein
VLPNVRSHPDAFRLLANQARVMIWTSAPDKLCDWFNAAWLEFTGRTMHQELGNGWTEGVHPDDLSRCLSIYATAFDRREEFSMEYRVRRHDGVYRWVLDIGSPYFSADGKFCGYFGACIDVTESKRHADARIAQPELERIGLRTGVNERAAEPSDLERDFHDRPSAVEIRAAIERIVASDSFRLSPQLAAFLRFVVEATLRGEGERIKGYTIAVEALGRGEDFDPQADPIVRVEAGRLRRALEQYYAGPGAADLIAVEVPRGRYVPKFRYRHAEQPIPVWSGSERGSLLTRALHAWRGSLGAIPSRRRILLIVAVLILIGIALVLAFGRNGIAPPNVRPPD